MGVGCQAHGRIGICVSVSQTGDTNPFTRTLVRSHGHTAIALPLNLYTALRTTSNSTRQHLFSPFPYPLLYLSIPVVILHERSVRIIATPATSCPPDSKPPTLSLSLIHILERTTCSLATADRLKQVFVNSCLC